MIVLSYVGSLCGQQPVKHFNYRHLTVADHLPCGVPHPVQTVKEDVGDGHPYFPPLYLDGVKLRGVGAVGPVSLCPTHVVQTLSHGNASEGAGIVRYNAHFPVTPVQVFDEIYIPGRCQVVTQLQIQGIIPQSTDHMDGPLGVVDGNYIPSSPAPYTPARYRRVA